MIISTLFLLFFVQFSYVAGNANDWNSPKFRGDYWFSKPADGWFKLHEVPQTWRTAQLMCHDEGAVLVSPLSRHLRYAIIDFMKWERSSVHSIFTGVHSTYAKGVYASIEGVPIFKLAIEWAAGDPDNRDNSEDCLAMDLHDNGTMRDVRCTHVLPFVCYKKRTKSLIITGCGTHDTEYNLDHRTGSCYKFHRRGLIWEQAYRTCMAEGGHLAIINSEQESVVIKEIYAKNPDNVIFSRHGQFASIGMKDKNDGGSWMTIHGETLKEAGFTRWQQGEPNNASQPEGELCGVTDRNNGNLWDAPCSWVMPFICEKQTDSLLEYDELYR